MLSILITSQNAWAAGTTLHNIRVGIHRGYTRIVFDSEGARPFQIGPASSEGITVWYERLDIPLRAEQLSQKSRGDIVRIDYREEQNISVVSIAFKHPDTKVNTYFLEADPPKGGGYRLVFDLYPPEGAGSQKAPPSSAETRKHVAQSARREGNTRLHKVRIGTHPGFTRMVLDSEGARPLQIGPASPEGITLKYEQLDLLVKPERLSRKSRGDILKIDYREEDNISVVSIAFKHPDTKVNTYFLEADPPKGGEYRLVMDFHPPETPTRNSSGTDEKIPVVLAAPALGLEAKARSKESEPGPAPPLPHTDSEEKPGELTGEKEAPEEESSMVEPVLSGEAGVVIRDTDVEGDAAKFEQYRDMSQPVFGELNVRYDKEEGFAEFNALNIARDDQYLHGAAGLYGDVRIDVIYDKIPHRFATGAETLYSGIGTGNLTLDDALQTRLQNGTSTIESEFSNAVSGDPEISRDKASLNVDIITFDPFNFRVESSREVREGTRPFFGSFGEDNTGEIAEPIDYETTELKVISEYAKRPIHLSATYNFSKFKNDIDTLTWDNPFRVTDALFGPSKGLIDLPPDNEYHNVSISGSIMDLPLKSRISATAAWGWMRQDDDLVPYTTNTAIATPPLPSQKVDAEVNTTLYHALLTSRPFNFMRFKGKFRQFKYDNRTEQINFPGFVDTDDFFVSTPIVNLPVSYKKTTAGGDLGFDVSSNSRITLGYTFDQTRRENREVAEQKHNIYRGAFDMSSFSWLDLRASYERTERDISDYDFDVYLAGGEDLLQLPGLRKYTQADLVRDRVQFLATVYPSQSLVLSGSAIYGHDDFEDSPYGLIEDRHHIFSFDADYSITDRLNLRAFYTYEKYENRQKANGEVPSVPAVDADWFSKSEEIVNTVGGAVKIDLIRNRLEFHSSYSFSDVDGHIDFFTPAVSTSEFPIVDETRLHILETKLKYNVGQGFSILLGHLWEKFEFKDFNTEGFTNTPTGAVLMGTLPGDYDAHVVYLKLSYRF